MDFFKTKKGLLILGIFAGLGAVALALGGNPKNMAICIACFIRDSAGAMKFHTAAPVQYFRPEIVGMVLGALVMAVASKEYRSTGGSSPVTRFALGGIMMIGALVFLGCPLRMVLRMASGDISSYRGLIESILSSPIVAMVISGDHAIEKIRKINGATDPKKAEPATIRGRFGLELPDNTVHASDSIESADREIAIWFSETEL